MNLTEIPLVQHSMNTGATIRPAKPSDLAAITEIYNEAILTTTATFDTEPKQVSVQERWFESHDERHPVLVTVLDNAVVGWVSLTRWSDRKAYDETGEISFYVRSEFRARGLGRQLTDAIIEEARRSKFHTLIARVAGESAVSLRLCRSCGFIDVGVMQEAGRKFGRLLDVNILQKML